MKHGEVMFNLNYLPSIISLLKYLKIKQESKHAILEFIEVFYNRIRNHSANQYLSPIEFENTQLKLRECSIQ